MNSFLVFVIFFFYFLLILIWASIGLVFKYSRGFVFLVGFSNIFKLGVQTLCVGCSIIIGLGVQDDNNKIKTKY